VDRTLNPVPLTDTYDSTKLQFLYAEPPVSSQSAGTMTWDNLGPLYAGGTKTIKVYFKALATVASTTNTASVTTAKFASGRNANSVTDNATVGINSSFSLSGKTWIDSGGTIGWAGTTGYDTIPTTDAALPDVKMDLYVCVGGNGLPIAYISNRSNACGANPGEYWKLVGTTYTDRNGDYTFAGLRPGYYNVRANGTALPTGMTTQTAEATGAANGSGGSGGNGEWNDQALAVKDLAYLSANTTQVNFGYRNPTLGTVDGYVWHDQDQGGYNDWDATEPPIPGATVTLSCTGTGCGSTSYTTTTDQNGYYQFSNLPVTNATYQVVITPPSGMGQTADPNYATGSCYGTGNCDNKTNTFTLTAGGAHGPDLFGYYGGLTIGDTVYVDWNGDGSQNVTTEEGIAGVQVNLYRDTNGNGVVDSGEPLIGTTTTASDGTYQFTNQAGNNNYVVAVNTSTLPAGYTQTGDPDESGTCSTCDSKDPLPLGSSNYWLADFGYQPRGYSSIGDTVWIDTDGDGVQDASELGKSGVVVNLYQDQNGNGVIDSADAQVATATTMGYNVYDGYIDTNNSGGYDAGDDLASLMGVRVIDGGLDINRNGIIDAGDDGAFVGYTVIDGHLDMNNSGSVTTADDGNLLGRYQFIGLPAGNYIVDIPSSNFGTGGALAGLSQSGDPDSTTVFDNKDPVSLGSSQTYVLGDFGYTSSAIGDTVWQDNNGNGLQDAGEPGIQNVVVQLWQDTNNDGTADTQVGTTTTDANGHYYFTGLPGGDYEVRVAASNFSSGGPLYQFTQTYDPDQPIPCSGGGCDNQGELLDTTAAYGLPLGQIDYSIDFGYRPLGRIGDTLWIDTDNDGVRDAGESGIPNVDVNLCADVNCNTILKTIPTDENGYYSFGNLADGTYYVRANTSDPDFPSGLTNTYAPDGTTDSKVDLIVMSGGVVTSIGGTPCSGCDMNVDLGYRYIGLNSVSGDVFFDPNNDAVQQSGETNVYPGVTVYLWNSSGQLIATTTTNTSGHYTFGSLPDGNYTVSYSPDAPSLDGLQPTVTSTPTTYRSVSLDPTGVIPGAVDVGDQDFGLLSGMDFGDLPSNYPITLASQDGARHLVPSTGAVYLGTAAPDTEWNGQPSASATGDNTNNQNDEAGVVRTPSVNWAPGANGGSIDVTVGGCVGSCYLSGWIDWNNDGDVADPGERILTGRTVSNGTTTLTFAIPTGTSFSGVTYYARFRLYDTYNSLVTMPTGLVYNGEVEDYAWSWAPTAVDLASFTAQVQDQAILLEWATATEFDTVGFYLFRADGSGGPAIRLNGELIGSHEPGSPAGSSYTFLDDTAVPGVTYTYWLEDVDIYGVATRHGPVVAVIPVPGTMPYQVFLPMVNK
jgi:hypothetical protein